MGDGASPRVFISYAREDAPHITWVKTFATQLIRHGVDVKVDTFDLHAGDDVAHFASQHLQAADAVLLICTPKYKRKFDARENGVGYEAGLITNDKARSKYIPIVRRGTWDDAVPFELQGVLGFDLTPEITPRSVYFELLERFFRGRTRPSLGTRPAALEDDPAGAFALADEAHDPDAEALARYRAWVFAAHGNMRMVGVKAADWSWELDRIYVPLSLEPQRAELDLGGTRWLGDPVETTVGIEDIFRSLKPHQSAAVMGDAGTGKTTALKKLLHLVLQRGPETVQLPSRTLPAFLRLAELKRYFKHKSPLWSLFSYTMQRASAGELPEDVARLVWKKPVLLLLDGLDELAHPQDRKKALDTVERTLQGRPDFRAVISCRRSARGQDMQFPARFRRFTVRPLSDERRQQLTEVWFTEAYREMGRDDPEEAAQKEAIKLMKEVGDVAILDRHHRILLSTPLFATLLCIIHLTDDKLPDTSVRFLERSLEILLDRRQLLDVEHKPVDAPALMRVLEDVGLRIQEEARQDGLKRAEWELWVKEALDDRLQINEQHWRTWLSKYLVRRPSLQGGLVSWLHQDADVLEALGYDELIFKHRGFQEYLAAKRIRDLGRYGLAMLARHADPTTWRETFLFVVRMLESDLAAGLLRQVLRRSDWVALHEILREMLVEHPNFPVEPFLAPLRSGTPACQALILELFSGRTDPELVQTVQGLRTHDARVQALAQIWGQAPQPAGHAAIPGQPFVEPTTQIRFLWVPGGTFMMGSEEGKDSERPVHRVTVGPFWLAETPVTNRQYTPYVKASRTEPQFWRDGQYNQPEQPVVGVSWEDTTSFCQWLTETLHLKVRLPREAEWEFAARGMDGRCYPWGNDSPNDSLAWYGNLGATPKPIGQYPKGKGPFGHLDLAGNVWEWCRDSFLADVYERPEHQQGDNPEVKANVEQQVLRGGSVWNVALRLRSAYRSGGRTQVRYRNVGFRPCIVPPSQGF